MFPAAYLAPDGRVVNKISGLSLGSNSPDAIAEAVDRELLEHYLLGCQVRVRGSIVPALEVVRLEHRLRAADFIAIAGQSPAVPVGHVELFGRGLWYGWEGDFPAAIHMLAPQVEHMVRFHLKEAGRPTTTVDGDGIENEKGLSSLMEDPAVDQILGQDIAFEIRALFCTPSGPNLRNDVAHGLLTDTSAASIMVGYAWWFCLRLVVLNFWNKARPASAPGGAPEGASQPASERTEQS
jgi:hypothetical protein